MYKYHAGLFSPQAGSSRRVAKEPGNQSSDKKNIQKAEKEYKMSYS
jgi:hypothetical protein